VKDQGGGPVIFGRWRDGSRVVERAIGPGWLVAAGERGAKPNGKTIGRWRERSGRPPEGAFNVQAAMQELARVEERWYVEKAQANAVAAVERARSLTLRDAADRYLAWGETDDPHTARDGWKHSHARNTRALVNRIVRELGADRPVAEIAHGELVAFMGRLVPERNGKPTGTKPTRKFLSNYALPLKGMFALALREGWVLEDVTLGLPSYKPRRKRAADPMRREEYLTPEEVVAVIGRLENQQDRAMVTTMAMAGLRPGEALALRWQDVDLPGSNLRIVESRTMGVTGSPKSGSGRTLPMPPELARELATVGLRKALTHGTELVFISTTAGHVDLAALRNRFNAAQDAAGIAPRRELRQLRNTFGTVMAAAGVPLRTIQDWMGHENMATTERYASHMPRSKDAALVSAAFAVAPELAAPRARTVRAR